MNKQDILTKIEELKKDNEKIVKSCDMWKSKKSDHGACLNYNGYYTNNVEIKELKDRLNEL